MPYDLHAYVILVSPWYPTLQGPPGSSTSMKPSTEVCKPMPSRGGGGGLAPKDMGYDMGIANKGLALSGNAEWDGQFSGGGANWLENKTQRGHFKVLPENL